MTAADAAAERLHTLYLEELRRSLMRPPVHPIVNVNQIQAMIRHPRGGGSGLCEGLDAKTWIWSDLHLGHDASITAFDRPFRRFTEDGPGDEGPLGTSWWAPVTRSSPWAT